jgi:trimeric autotransporter adhesin
MALHVFVIKETELEDPQDLRAELEKYSNSTNERKNMSTKTLRKRIALVAVAALGAGVLSVAPANAADNTAISQGATGNASAAADILNIATINSLSPAIADSAAASGSSSNGLLSRTATPGTTGTATLLSTGALTVYTAAPGAGDLPVLIVSGATVTSAKVGSGYAIFNSTATAVSGSADAAFGAVIKPNAGVSSFTVSYYNGATATATNPGTLRTQYIVTVAASSAAGAYSAAKSAVSLSGSTQSTTLTTGDVSGADTQATGGTAYINFSLADAYGSALDVDALVATASKGSLVAIGDATGSINKGTAATAVDGASAPTNLAVRVDHATSGVAVTETVTLTYAGTVVATKTIKFQGHAASIKISSVKIQTLSETTSSSNVTFKADLADSAGNVLLATGRESFWSVDSGANTTVAGAVIKAAATLSGSTYASATGTHSCASTAGSADIVLKYINTDGSVVKSSPVKLSCAGLAATYTAALDKASYVTGEIATLTVSFKDSKGNAANDFQALPTTGGNNWIEASLPQTTIVGTAPAAAQTPAAGVLTLKYSIGTNSGISAGTWTGTVDVKGLNSTTTPQTTQTVTYKVGTGDAAGVTNADVLKAIVSLIASINKQIAALQKALLRR